MEEKNKQINDVIDSLKNGNYTIYFFVMDTKGNPTGAMACIYDHAKTLKDKGLNVSILHEKNDYTGVSDWMGEEYMEIPHISIESKDVKITPQDFLIIPEIFSNVMDQTKNMPCKRIVFCQSYDYIFEILPLGSKWEDYGIKDVITTSDVQKNHIQEIFKNINVDVIPIGIPEFFKRSDKPQIPVISILSRDPRDTIKLVKSFYLKFPQFKWVSFRDLRGLPRTTFADELSKSCLAVWIDQISGFGTFPIEAMKCGVPVIGKIPNLIPEWMGSETENGLEFNDNGIWLNDILKMPDVIATFIKLWLEDNIPNDAYDKVSTFIDKRYDESTAKDKVVEYYNNLIVNRIIELDSLIIKQEETIQ